MWKPTPASLDTLVIFEWLRASGPLLVRGILEAHEARQSSNSAI